MNPRKYYIYILAFVSGMCVMAVELAASRLMAPYFGTSTFVWTNIIGVIMIALSIGYILGGKIADKRPELNVLLKFILSACVFLLIIPFLAPPLVTQLLRIMTIFQSASLYIFIGSLTFFSP